VQTISNWKKKYGRAGLRHEVAMMNSEEELQREKELEARIKELEAALSQLQLDKFMLETTLEVARELYGEDFENRYGSKSLMDLMNKGKKQVAGSR
jgi:hypothetical protein